MPGKNEVMQSLQENRTLRETMPDEGKKEGGHIPRILVGQVRFSKAHTVKVRIRNENCTLGEAEALLGYGADTSIGDLNFLKRMGLRKTI